MKNRTQDELIKHFVFLFFVIFCLVQASILFDTHFLSGESSTLSNVPIEYFLNNKWHYPLHAHDLFYPGIDVFMLHPPLHYLLTSLWIDLFGIGTWQLLLQSAVSGTLGIAVTTFVLMRVSGANAAIFVPVLASISAAYLFCSTELRADLSFGFVHSLTVLVLGLLIFQKPSRDKQIFLSFLFGLLVLSALATHWFGFFTQLYLPCFVALMILKQKGSSVMLISSCFAGVAFGMTCWFWFFGEDLLLSFIAVLFKGSDFLQTFTMGNKYYLSFLTEWPGGNILLIGLVFGTIKSVFDWAGVVFLGGSKSPSRLVPMFILVNIIAYSLFFNFFVGNRHPQYSGNIIFLLFALSALGYGFIFSLLKKIGLGRKVVITLSQISAICFLCSSPVTQALSTKFLDLNEVKRNNAKINKETNTILRNLIASNSKVLLGTSTYPYLFDRTYVSSMALYAKHVLSPEKKMPLLDFVKHYSDMSINTYLFGQFSISERSKALDEFTHIALTDKGHGWQNLFFDPEVWRQKFIEVGILILPKQTLERSVIAPNQKLNYASAHHIFQRNELRRIKEIDSYYPEIYELANGTLLVTSGRLDKIAFYSGRNWKLLTSVKQKTKIYEYLDFINWYNANLDEQRKSEIVENIFPLVRNYINSHDGGSSYGSPNSRSLSQAVDHAFIGNNFPPEFPRKQLSELLKQ